MNNYNNIVNLILEKYNSEEIDADTCIALMERAADNYIIESNESEFEDKSKDEEKMNNEKKKELKRK